jgi:hypothetical protein
MRVEGIAATVDAMGFLQTKRFRHSRQTLPFDFYG